MNSFIKYYLAQDSRFEIQDWKRKVLTCILTLFRMGFFGAARRWGGGVFLDPLPKIHHTYPTMMQLGTVIPYLRKIQNMYKSRDTSLEFCWHKHFFTGNQQILLHQEIHIQIGFWYIISNYFNFSWVFSIFFNKHGYNFDDVSKHIYSRSSENKDVLK